MDKDSYNWHLEQFRKSPSVRLIFHALATIIRLVSDEPANPRDRALASALDEAAETFEEKWTRHERPATEE